ncbi:hypothetical protein TNCV_10321 [Trichonephila clavipes]|nr:hypothetical protein TNCV_10321 [Trichonephila clavipes]
MTRLPRVWHHDSSATGMARCSDVRLWSGTVLPQRANLAAANGLLDSPLLQLMKLILDDATSAEKSAAIIKKEC